MERAENHIDSLRYLADAKCPWKCETLDKVQCLMVLTAWHVFTFVPSQRKKWKLKKIRSIQIIKPIQYNNWLIQAALSANPNTICQILVATLRNTDKNSNLYTLL